MYYDVFIPVPPHTIITIESLPIIHLHYFKCSVKQEIKAINYIKQHTTLFLCSANEQAKLWPQANEYIYLHV